MTEPVQEVTNSKAKTFGPVIPKKLTPKLDDEEFFRLYKEGALERQENGLTEENWEEEIEKMPLFMTKNPTAEQVAASPDLQAMQTLIDLDTTPESRAEFCKGQGNEIFMNAKKQRSNKKAQFAAFKQAIKAYGEGLEEKCSNAVLNSALLSNRAAVNLLMGNNRRVITDCTEAIELNPKNVKAYWRACLACMKLDLFREAIAWCDKGLLIDPSNKNLSDDRIKSVKAAAAKEKKIRMDANKARKAAKITDNLRNAFEIRGIKFKESIEVEMDKSQKALAQFGAKVFLDDQKLLHWPVMFMYPEHQQSDYVKDFCEGHSFEAHLANMFGQADRPPWDTDNKYKAENIEVYFETARYKGRNGETTDLIKVDPRLSLLETVRDPRFTVVDFTPAFIIAVKDTPFIELFKKDHHFEGLAVDVPADLR